MATISEMKARFETLLTNAGQMAQYVLETTDEEAIKLVQEQLRQGKDGNDNFLAPYRDPEYAAYKLTLNPLGVTDLRLHGSFYEGMLVQADETSLSIISNDVKWAKLARKYGLDITRLSPESKQFFVVNSFQPRFIKLICDYTGAQAA